MLKGITIGCGFFGSIHMESWYRVENARIVAVVDKNEKQAKKTASQFSIMDYTDIKEAIEKENPDFVDIATRPDSHCKIAKIAASKGCHVLCQKPIASSWEESVKLVETCKKHNVRLMINENWRWQPWYQQIKELIKSEVIGKVITITITREKADALYTSPFPDQPYFVDMKRFLLIESVIHPIDVVRFLGGEIEEVFCDLRRVSGVTQGEDSVYVHLSLKDDVWGMIYLTRCSEPNIQNPICDYARIEGKKGFIRLERDGTIIVKPLFESPFREKYEIPEVGYRGDSCRAALQHFVDCLLSDEQFETEGEDYLNQVMRTVFAGYESARKKKVVKI